jgi:hypothetical protein
MAGAQPPAPPRPIPRVSLGAGGYSGCSLVPLGCEGHAQGYSGVLEGTEGARGRRASLYGTMGGWVCGYGWQHYARTRTHPVCADVCTCASGACTPGVHVLRSASFAWRAGKYAWGAVGKNTCPDGTTRINDLTACQAAATAAGKNRPSSSEIDDLAPKGCYSDTTSTSVFFNAHVTGVADQIQNGFLLCAVTGVPASPAPPRPRRANTCTRGRRHSIGAYSTVLTGTVPCPPCAHPERAGPAWPTRGRCSYTDHLTNGRTDDSRTDFTSDRRHGRCDRLRLPSTALRTHAPPVCRRSLGVSTQSTASTSASAGCETTAGKYAGTHDMQGEHSNEGCWGLSYESCCCCLRLLHVEQPTLERHFLPS